MSINKSQRQTMQDAGICLEHPCFSRGELYVAFSRVSAYRNVYDFADNGKTINIVYKRALI